MKKFIRGRKVYQRDKNFSPREKFFNEKVSLYQTAIKSNKKKMVK